MDDGIDNVRIEAAVTLKSLWNGLNLETYNGDSTHSAHVDYLFSTLLIHLDDHDVKFQEHILGKALKFNLQSVYFKNYFHFKIKFSLSYCLKKEVP